MTKIDIGAWLADARQRLIGTSEQPLSEAQTLLGDVLGKPRAWIMAHPEAQLRIDQQDRLDGLLERLALGEPLPYLLGRWEFYGLYFSITPDVLIPRPETELLVEEALNWLRKHPDQRAGADVGTGSGCIAVTLTHHISDLQITATDRSTLALRVARKNADSYGLQEQVKLVETDLLSGEAGPFDLVCANLPYIPTAKLPNLEVTRHEPRTALDGGPDGLDLIRRLLEELPNKLAPGGLALFEIESGQGENAGRLGRQSFPGAEVNILPDLAGLPRILKIKT